MNQRAAPTTAPDDRSPHQGGRQGEPRPVYQRDDGQYQVGLDPNAPGPFPSRPFAEQVAEQVAERLSR